MSISLISLLLPFLTKVSDNEKFREEAQEELILFY